MASLIIAQKTRNKHPLFLATSARNGHILPVGAGPNEDHLDVKIPNRWNSAVSRLHEKRRSRRHIPLFQPQSRRNERIFRLGQGRTWTIPTSESQIVGKWPFSNRARNTERNEAGPLQATTPEKRAYLVGWGRKRGAVVVFRGLWTVRRAADTRPRPVRHAAAFITVRSGAIGCSTGGGPSNVPRQGLRGAFRPTTLRPTNHAAW